MKEEWAKVYLRWEKNQFFPSQTTFFELYIKFCRIKMVNAWLCDVSGIKWTTLSDYTKFELCLYKTI